MLEVYKVGNGSKKLAMEAKRAVIEAMEISTPLSR